MEYIKICWVVIFQGVIHKVNINVINKLTDEVFDKSADHCSQSREYVNGDGFMSIFV